MEQSYEDTLDLVLDSIEHIIDQVDDLEELRQIGNLIGSKFDEREGLLEARLAYEEEHGMTKDKEIQYLRGLLLDMVVQNCRAENDVYFSGFISTHAEAMRYLVHAGIMKCDHPVELITDPDDPQFDPRYGRIVHASIIPPDPKPEEE